jgi:hypothetical protein
MKNLFSYIILVICIAIYMISLSEPLTKKIAEYKYRTNSIWGSDKYRFGDLFGMSYYPGFQIPLSMKATHVMEKCDTSRKGIDLYGLCDSYVWSILPSDTFYCNVDKLQFATVNYLDYLRVQLDTTKANILLIEFAERNTLLMLQNHFTYLTEFLTVNHNTTLASPVSKIDSASNSFIFNNNINTNLEFNIFETSLFTPIKNFKASLNHNFFKAPDKNVAIGPDKKYLLYQPTLDPALITSSFKAVSDIEIDTLVNRLNSIYFQYKKMGFTEVYFSIIPNPVTILYPTYNGYTYNQLIQRIQNHVALKIPVIDIYSDFKKADFPLYFPSDSHWNMDGAFVWLNKLNHILARIEK